MLYRMGRRFFFLYRLPLHPNGSLSNNGLFGSICLRAGRICWLYPLASWPTYIDGLAKGRVRLLFRRVGVKHTERANVNTTCINDAAPSVSYTCTLPWQPIRLRPRPRFLPLSLSCLRPVWCTTCTRTLRVYRPLKAIWEGKFETM